MDKPAIYIETSVISYLVARPSRDIIVAAHQQITSDWWDQHRHHYDLFISQVVLDEARAGDKQEAAKRLAAIQDLPSLEINEDVIQLAEGLVQSNAIPNNAAQDALHIAIACVNGVDYLLTWNCKHIANAKMRSRIDMVCRDAGYVPPIICTPEELEE
jgi:predicted nucleic acid-binding protein